MVYHNIFCSDIASPRWSSVAANGYEKRIIGFKAEVEAKILFDSMKNTVLDGGWMLSNLRNKRCLDNSFYFTISNDPPEKYVSLYSLLRKLNFIKLFFIRYTDYASNSALSDPLGIGNQILTPIFSCFEFQNDSFVEVSRGSHNLQPLTELYTTKTGTKYRSSFKLNKPPIEFAQQILECYSERHLFDILAKRIVFDGLLGFNKERGIPSDIDLVIPNGTNFTFLEIKEKDKSKTPPQGFGMDVDRIFDILKIKQALNCEYLYVVKEVNNQTDRKFMNWWKISMQTFYDAVKNNKTLEGGAGMATAKATNHPTLVAPQSLFEKILSET